FSICGGDHRLKKLLELVFGRVLMRENVLESDETPIARFRRLRVLSGRETALGGRRRGKTRGQPRSRSRGVIERRTEIAPGGRGGEEDQQDRSDEGGHRTMLTRIQVRPSTAQQRIALTVLTVHNTSHEDLFA